MAAVQTSLPPDLPDPPSEYDQAYMTRLVGLLEQALFAMSQRRQVIASTINVDRLPTSAAGLRSGELWRDAAASNVVKVVP